MMIGAAIVLPKQDEQPVETQFPNPEGVKVFSGFGADESDLVRGFLQSGVREDAKYDKVNYMNRSTQPRIADEDQTNTEAMEDDFMFRFKNLRSRGFLTRPTTSTER